MSNDWFSLRSLNFRVEMIDSVYEGQEKLEHFGVVQSVTGEVIVKRSKRMVLSHQPQLSCARRPTDIRSIVAQDILMAEQHRTRKKKDG